MIWCYVLSIDYTYKSGHTRSLLQISRSLHVQVSCSLSFTASAHIRCTRCQFSLWMRMWKSDKQAARRNRDFVGRDKIFDLLLWHFHTIPAEISGRSITRNCTASYLKSRRGCKGKLSVFSLRLKRRRSTFSRQNRIVSGVAMPVFTVYENLEIS